MRIIQGVLFLAFLAAIGVFAVQNMNVITVSFWNWNISQPIAIVIVAVYIVGMLSGWTVMAFARRSLRRVTERPGH
jgi:lipopolysaccharide assembly protein A